MILRGAARKEEVRVQRAIPRRSFFLHGNLKDAIGGVEFSGELMFGYGEGSPIYFSAAPARRSGPTLAIKLSRCCEVVGARPMSLAAWRRVSILAILRSHPGIGRTLPRSVRTPG